MTSFWDERYGSDVFAYGIEPNDFLRAEAWRIPPGPVLCLAEGEGRNAVYLASRGHAVTAVDASVEGLKKAERLARARGVSIELVHADLSTWELGRGRYSGVVSIFGHLAPEARRRVHGEVAAALSPGGVFLLEAYRPGQIELGTGGPRNPSMLMTLPQLREELRGLELVFAEEVEREIHEGAFHDGLSRTVQIVGVRR